MSLSAHGSRIPAGGMQTRYAESSYGRPASQAQPAFSASSSSQPSPTYSQSQFSGTARPPSSVPSSSSPFSSSLSSSSSAGAVSLSSTGVAPLSSDDRSAAIADYVEKRRQAKLNAEGIRKERAREAEMRRMNGRGATTTSSSSNSSTSPSVPRAGIVTSAGASSTSSSEANSASSSRRASRGRDGQQADWSGVSEYEEANRARQRDGVHNGKDDDEDEQDAPLHRYAKPLSRTTTTTTTTTTTASTTPYPPHQQAAQAAQPHSYQQQPRALARPLSPSAAPAGSRASAPSSGSSANASVSALSARVSELESEVAALHSQQRLFLAFMETTQSQLALMRAAAGGANMQHTATEGAGGARGARQSKQPQSSTQQRSSPPAHPAAARPDVEAEQKEYRELRADSAGQRSGQSHGRRPHEQRYQAREEEQEDEQEQQHEEEGEEEEETVSYSSRTYSRGVPSLPQRAPLTHSSDDSSRAATFAQPARPTSRPEQTNAQPTSQQQRAPSRSPPPQRAEASSTAFAPPISTPSSYDLADASSLESDPFPLQATYPCPNCGRSFNEAALERHVAKALCQKAARKPFDVAAQRLQEVQSELSQVKTVDRKQGGAAAAAARKQQQSDEATADKQSKWRQERARLQEAIQAGKQISQAIKEGKPLSSIPVAVSSIPDDRVQCPHCLRKFAEHTADRHIPHCKNTQSRMASKQTNASSTQKRR